MKNAFLRQTATHYLGNGQIEGTLFVFPTRRSSLFFRKHLTDLGYEGRCRTATLDEFMHTLSGRTIPERTDLLLRLYDCYAKVHPTAEDLDEFIFWGDILLKDFDDIDRSMADGSRLLRNATEFREMKDPMDYLTEEQKKALGRLLGDDAPKSGGVREKFIGMWNLLCPIYESFKASLSAEGLAYEGMAHRLVADNARDGEDFLLAAQTAFRGARHFAFIGMNYLSACEKAVLGRLRRDGAASFCWDYASALVRNSLNPASAFMRENIALFGQAFAPVPDAEHLPRPSFRLAGVPSASGQAMLLPQVLRGADPLSTAVILPDGRLLPAVLDAIPEDIQDINVTMGLTLSQSPVSALMDSLCELQTGAVRKDGRIFFRHETVRDILSNSAYRKTLDEAGAEDAARIQGETLHLIPSERFESDESLARTFSDAFAGVEDPSGALLGYLDVMLTGCAAALHEEDPGQAEFALSYRKCVRTITDKKLRLRPETTARLLHNIAAATRVSFDGEPVSGLQVMGEMETRSLDFDTVVILSCNEGSFPSRRNDPSFLPQSIRAAFGLPTRQTYEAMEAYNFYRLIQRAGTVWMLYDTRTEKMKGGEESRYVKQLRHHYRYPIREYFLAEGLPTGIPAEEDTITKTPDYGDRIRAKELSATALQHWLACPAMFHYSFVEGLRPEDDVAVNLDAGTTGTVFHSVMQSLYTGEEAMESDFDFERGDRPRHPLTEVDKTYILARLADEKGLRAKIRALICRTLNTPEVTGRNLVIEEIIYRYARKTLERDLDLLETHHATSFKILGLEKKMTWEWNGFRFKGFIDRMDSLEDGRIRIADYKTGKVTREDIDIRPSNAARVADDLFGEDNRKRPKIALQLFLYDMFATGGDESRLDGIDNVIYPASALFTDMPPAAAASSTFCSIVKEKLAAMLDEMADTSKPIRRTCDRNTCSWCPFRDICGR